MIDPETPVDTTDAIDAPPPGVDSAVDPERKRRRETKKARLAREDREFFQFMVASAAGRRFMWSILREAHAFETMFPAGPAGFPDPNAAWFEHGKQDLGQRLYQSWHAKAPGPVMQMLMENDTRFQQLEGA